MIDGAAAPQALAVGPELTVYQVAELRTLWLARYAGGLERIDLAAVAEIDGAGLQLLLSLCQLARRDGRPLSIVNPSDPVREALALIGAQALANVADADREAHHA